MSQHDPRASTMKKSEALILLVLLPAMFLACPEQPPPSPVLFEPTVYGAPGVSCYPLPSGDTYCECSLPDLPEVPAGRASAVARSSGRRGREAKIGWISGQGRIRLTPRLSGAEQ